jgi:hypothetical protein
LILTVNINEGLQIGLAQEHEDVTLDGVDERRRGKSLLSAVSTCSKSNLAQISLHRNYLD